MQSEIKTKKPIWLRLLTAFFLILLGLFVLLSLLLFVTQRWMFTTWNSLSIDEIIFHLNASLDGTSPEMIHAYIFKYGIFALLGFVAFVVTMILTRNRRFYRAVAVFLWIALSIGLIEFSGYDTDQKIGLREYILDSISPVDAVATGDFIGDHYVDAGTATLTFPKEKRNLIYIYLESMEMTYADQKSGGAFEQNVIPELTKLAKEGEDFSGDSAQINGAISLPGSTWTIGALFAQTSGMPLKMPAALHQEVSHLQKDFFSSLTVLGDVLEQQGYQQVFMIGSDAEFGGRRSYYSSHGDYEICDYSWAQKNGVIPEDYFVFWGFEDEILFDAAKKKIQELADDDQPFNFSLLTVDTHFEDGYVCDLCPDRFGDNQYANVMACSSKQVYDFVRWIQKQDFYDNTTIVLCGDHPTMDVDFCQDVPETYQRRTFLSILNSAVEPVDKARRREFSTMDMYPTTLAALGVNVKGNRLGLGTNLFSLTDTLVEQFGKDTCAEGIRKKTPYMDKLFYGFASEGELKTAALEAELSYKITDEGKVNFILEHTTAVEIGSLKSVVLELTDADGNMKSYDMNFFQPEHDEEKYYCYLITDLKEADLTGMKAEAFFSTENYDHYSIATWSK